MSGQDKITRFPYSEIVPAPKAPLGPPPECLNFNQTAVWIDLVAEIPPGILGRSDRFILEELAVATWALMERRRIGMKAHDILKVVNVWRRQFFLGPFEQTPPPRKTAKRGGPR